MSWTTAPSNGHNAWLDNQPAAEATYGHISTWETGGDGHVVVVLQISIRARYYNSGASSFNDDIGAWDTSGVTTTTCIGCSWLDNRSVPRPLTPQDIGAWDTSGVTTM